MTCPHFIPTTIFYSIMKDRKDKDYQGSNRQGSDHLFNEDQSTDLLGFTHVHVSSKYRFLVIMISKSARSLYQMYLWPENCRRRNLSRHFMCRSAARIFHMFFRHIEQGLCNTGEEQ